MANEKFDFSAGLKKKVFFAFAIGAVMLLVGGLFPQTNEHHGDDHGSDHATEEHHDAGSDSHGDDTHSFNGAEDFEAVTVADSAEAGEEHGAGWFKRFKVDLWINNVYFTGLALIGIFFFALQYAAQAGWSAYIVRIPLAMGQWIVPAGILMLLTWFFVNHDVFHWTHSNLYDPTDSHYDELIAGKSGFFFFGEGGGFPTFFIARMVIFFVLWAWLFTKLKNLSLAEDELGGDGYWFKMRKWSAIFLVIFAVSSSVSAWDWVMSVDTHWFSTMFGWYVFASWWVTGLAFITLVTVLLKEAGYLPQVTSNHLHDLGKFVFAFSIFWTYVWFSQFLLIYYANIPEESVYFVERFLSDKYSPLFFINIILNFIFPFLVLMTRDAKRLNVFLKMVCIVVMFGHFIDFYLMMTPGTMGQNGFFGFTEIGMFLMFGSAFVFVVLRALSSYALLPKNHPMLGEAKHHHI
ncbi:MAG: quinol:cytochrome C oxidoreductase [Roseivirga sp.]|jgi:hypothetical protein|uniref:quinol:cytochrome C oxidoreductase n=1 Tax=Roseivirga sp. TaxID=1964215 RepID=UPI001B05BDAD|nr:quinol:cytochrome C oxidoreductase [Roseivirga sp.]MBO6659239.1 quinol:cytochrome C oxidoreductase [Roseivirga sp.]MBO6760837.1 quinol:cytochrome C oxidoreductase [Roseivirga sp.]MBO6908024.1 quinol:cytochrome C oxidoreductase [Roseivirga sp.]